MDLLTLIGAILGIGAVLVGQALEGGHIGSLINGPAVLIVLGGSVGAVMVQSPVNVFVRSIRMLFWIFFPPKVHALEAIEKIVNWSNIARKEGLLGLETAAESEDDLFARKGLQLLVDGSEPDVIRSIMEVELDTKEHVDLQAAKVYESMGGYCPTVGIIGAVLGLIHVMENLADPSALGAGIATAFVATIYGVGLANLLLIPIGGKLKALVQVQTRNRSLVIEGLISIAEGENPRNIETKLQGYLH
jgi:chemotaxis protein MotA